jgi:hypothetical protein
LCCCDIYRPDETAANSPRDESELVAACEHEAERARRREARLARSAQKEVNICKMPILKDRGFLS